MNPQSPKLELSQTDLDKVAAAKARRESTKVDENELFVAEFGYYFGWEGVKAILNNEISMEHANKLITGVRKVWVGQVYDIANASFVGNISAKSRHHNQAFKRNTKDLLKQARADI